MKYAERMVLVPESESERVKDPSAYAQLKRGRKALTDLADKRKPLKHKRKILNQKGGFIGAVAAAALPLVIGEVARLIRRA